MARTVQCVKLGREAEGLDFPPYPGDLGKKLYDNVSKEAWAAWLKHQTRLINEYRLTPSEPKARKNSSSAKKAVKSRVILYHRPADPTRPGGKSWSGW